MDNLAVDFAFGLCALVASPHLLLLQCQQAEVLAAKIAVCLSVDDGDRCERPLATEGSRSIKISSGLRDTQQVAVSAAKNKSEPHVVS